MKSIRTDLLQDIFQKTGGGDFLTLYELEVEFGLSGINLRSLLEDLKEENLIVEHPEGFQISEAGRLYCRSRWL